MGSVIKDVFPVLLAVLIPLASFTTGLQTPKPGRGEDRLWRRPRQLLLDLVAVLLHGPGRTLVPVLTEPVTPIVRAGRLLAVLAVGIEPVAGMNRLGASGPHAHAAFDLNLVALVISMVFVPLAFALVAALFNRD